MHAERVRRARGAAIAACVAASVAAAAGCQAQSPPCAEEQSVRLLARAQGLALPLFESPMFLQYAGDTLRPFVVRNAAYFRSDGASVRCARALSSAILWSALDVYDPRAYERAIDITSRHGVPEFAADIAKSQNLAAGQMLVLALELQWLSEVLPSIVEGDMAPYQSTGTVFRQQVREGLPFLPILARDMGYDPVPALVAVALEEIRVHEESLVLLARSIQPD